MKLEEIEPIAEKYVKILEPYCNRIQIAGSIRRRKKECKDIEIVIIRKPERLDELIKVVDKFGKIKGCIDGRYTQRMLPEGVKLDIFIARDDGTNWGNILLIRTGSWKFNVQVIGLRSKEVGLKHKFGYLWDGDERLECREEEDVFRYLKMEYIEPEKRSW